MTLFSIRNGYKSVRDCLQNESVDERLKVKLWNSFHTYYFEPIEGDINFHSRDPIYKALWKDLLVRPINKCPDLPSSYKLIFQGIYDRFEWFEIYDFLEFVVNIDQNETRKTAFIEDCNKILNQELSGWHFAGSFLIPVTSTIEISEIEESLYTPSQVESHLQQAIEHLSNKTSPDYRNSIKESISAVEALCKLITKDRDATLSSALQRLEGKNIIPLHHDLKEAYRRIYDWTSDAEGIRHGIKDATTVDIEDAKYMLIACSAFINYLKVKAMKAGITLE
jgi:hypothetical protein